MYYYLFEASLELSDTGSESVTPIDSHLVCALHSRVLPCLGLFLVQYVAYSVFALPYMSYLVFVLQCLGLTFCALPCMSYLIWAFSLCSMWLTVSLHYLKCLTLSLS